MIRWKTFWFFQHWENCGFTLLTPIFGIELAVQKLPIHIKQAYWRGWRLLIWPILDTNSNMLVEFKYSFARIEEYPYMDYA